MNLIITERAGIDAFWYRFDYDTWRATRMHRKEIAQEKSTTRWLESSSGLTVTKIAPTDFVHATKVRKRGYRSRKGMERRERNDRSKAAFLGEVKESVRANLCRFSFEVLKSYLQFLDVDPLPLHAIFSFHFIPLCHCFTVSYSSFLFNRRNSWKIIEQDETVKTLKLLFIKNIFN